MSITTLSSIAIIKVNYEYGRSFYKCFIPIVLECTSINNYHPIEINEIQLILRERFGIVLPILVIDRILSHAKRSGFIKREGKTIIGYKTKIESLRFREKQTEILRNYDSLLTDIIQYARSNFHLEWEPVKASNALLAFLDEYNLSIISSTQDNHIIPPIQNIGQPEIFVINSYIRFLEESKSIKLVDIETLAKGIMIANAIYLPDPENLSRKFTRTSFYFDTRFLMQALGYSGQNRSRPMKELLELIYLSGGKLYCYKHTVQEIRSSLQACAKIIASAGAKSTTGPIVESIEYFLENSITSSDIILISNRLEKELLGLRIEVKDRSPYIEKYNPNEGRINELLEHGMYYRTTQAREKDVESITAILRNNRENDYCLFEDLPSIFVTTNRTLIRIIKSFYFEEYEKDTIPPFVSEYNLTNIIWLKMPIKYPDLPRNRIIADCYAATEPDEVLWGNYIGEINRLSSAKQITNDEYYLLRFDLESKLSLMKMTMGENRQYNPTMINTILSHAKEKIREGITIQLESERKKELDRKKRLEERSLRYSRIIITILKFAIAALWIIGALYSYLNVNKLGILLTSSFALLAVIDLLFIRNIDSTLRLLEVKLAIKIQNILEY